LEAQFRSEAALAREIGFRWEEAEEWRESKRKEEKGKRQE
jgi:hypothetical protein